MARPAARFRQMDITRALRGAQEAGAALKRLKIDPEGAITLDFTDAEPEAVAPVEMSNPWDEAV